MHTPPAPSRWLPAGRDAPPRQGGILLLPSHSVVGENGDRHGLGEMGRRRPRQRLTHRHSARGPRALSPGASLRVRSRSRERLSGSYVPPSAPTQVAVTAHLCYAGRVEQTQVHHAPTPNTAPARTSANAAPVSMSPRNDPAQIAATVRRVSRFRPVLSRPPDINGTEWNRFEGKTEIAESPRLTGRARTPSPP